MTKEHIIVKLASALMEFRSGSYCWCPVARSGNHTEACLMAANAMAWATFNRGIALSSMNREAFAAVDPQANSTGKPSTREEEN